MKIQKLTVVAALVGFAVVLLVPAAARAEAELEARIWSTEIDGTLQVTEGSLGTELDLADDLGIDDEEALEFRVTWRLPGPLVVRFGYMPLSYSSGVELSRDIEFGGITFPINFDLETDLDLDYARVGVGWLFRVSEEFRIGPMLEIKAVRAEAGLQAGILGLQLVSASESEEAAFVSIGAAVDYKPIPTLHLVAEAGYSPGLDYGEMIDAEVGIKFSPVKVFNIFAGYRLITLDLEHEDDTLDFDLSGPYLGASLSF